MRVCKTCNIEKEMSKFSKRDSGHRYICKSCTKSQYMLNYYPKQKESRKEYRELNKEKLDILNKNWVSLNIDRMRKIKSSWNSRNKSARAHHQALRRTRKMNAAFPGFENEIKQIYLNCPKGYHVDHIIPLRGKNVCGLHVPWNLQYLPAIENMKKGNRIWL